MDYIEGINKPPSVKGYSRATGEALAEFKYNGLTDEFEWFSLVPEEKWSPEEAESVCRYLEHLNQNREELTRPVRTSFETFFEPRSWTRPPISLTGSPLPKSSV